MSFLSRAALDSSLLFLAVVALVSASIALARYLSLLPKPGSFYDEACELALGAALAFFLVSPLIDEAEALALVFPAYLAMALVIRLRATRLSTAGVAWIAGQPLAILLGTAWACLFIAESAWPAWLQAMAFITVAGGVTLAAMGFIGGIARDAMLTHDRWRLPNAPAARPDPAFAPKVSLHLPCYSEPPEVVIATMESLAAQRYANFEVLVCDNNTADERLWRPLEAHCAVLNRRLGREVFRFFHVAPLAGAKAGALNFCLDVMAQDAELVGVIDADYLATPDFLSRLAPSFADPKLGYIQTPHDYRGYAGSDYLTACHWEYMPVNKVDWAGISEYGGAFTIGTMCLLRTRALKKVGGWAEWCLTEDSEVSVRLRAAGWHGYYFSETFGRGLIPETFDDYRKQRFRWTAGPVQQLRRHWRLFLPSPFAAPLPGWSKLLEVIRCVAPVQQLALLATGIIGTVLLGLAHAGGHAARVDIPDVVWAMIPIAVLTWGVRTVHRYRLSGCDDPAAMVLGEMARASLTYIVLVGGLAGLSRRPLAWRRTPKFAVSTGARAALESTATETALGLALAAIAMAALGAGQAWLGKEAADLLALQVGGLALAFLSAPAMALLAVTPSFANAPSAARLPWLPPLTLPVRPQLAQAAA